MGKRNDESSWGVAPLSRRGVKTANLPESVTNRIDALVRKGDLTTARNRDEFVRQAVAILIIALTGPTTGDKSLDILLRELVHARKPPP